MDRKQLERDAETANRQMNAPENAREKRAAVDLEGAGRPSSGATVQQAFAGAELAGEDRALEGGETAAAIKRAAENDRRP